ncbi:sulfurtransferase TusA family protein [Paenibacillus sp.]|jgi:rhodanese-related sulfurtransferase/TusA-related sulfurtransferase|uniref:sulfurtransferase TusA family protein n=1 Tax=Paenibacillus sp. TaxID=58172 RepID=UPI00281FD8EE|nr:sulfurtransferase TusA family protein [Paenibacillus sp.]MDR0269963.1 sulfurtransferase TusA family protein [Paenibacillus sp.]
MNIKVDQAVDAKGLACPMPIIRTKKAINELNAGQVLEIQATDKGSVADIQAWAKSTGHQFLGTQVEDDVYRHYVRKSESGEIKEEITFPHAINNEELEKLLEGSGGIHILDVREPAEFAFGRLKGSINIPLGDLEQRVGELNPEDEIYLICRTGYRSSMAAHFLTEQGFKQIKNVVPGMSQWTGSVERN